MITAASEVISKECQGEMPKEVRNVFALLHGCFESLMDKYQVGNSQQGRPMIVLGNGAILKAGPHLCHPLLRGTSTQKR
jgi:hypothetical protein